MLMTFSIKFRRLWFSLLRNMESPDNRLYMCSVCFQRYLWKDLSDKEHRCFRCRLPPKVCLICSTNFEPRDKITNYCKRCDFFIHKHVAVKPPPIPEGREDFESNREGTSFTERWEEIKAASGITDDYLSD
ncbi:protein FAM76B isoform X1 [Drosophila suzukii]|uniref:Protein FAM76B isoform X1 n=2 Tax=Drosophila suzukii TaxID=28584 RepID=A0AB39Z4K6_DROSZ